MMPAGSGGAAGPHVSLGELFSAWADKRTGTHPSFAGWEPTRGQAWTPRYDELVVPVIGTAPGAGTTSTALALATSAATHVCLPSPRSGARLVELRPPIESGLAETCTAELGEDPPWLLGTRGDVMVERLAYDPAGHLGLSVPRPSEAPCTVLDLGTVSSVVAHRSWPATAVRQAAIVVLVSHASIPGARRLEAALGWLTHVSRARVRVALVGRPAGRWRRRLQSAAGPMTRAAVDAGLVTNVPFDRNLAVSGLTTDDIATSVLRRTDRLITDIADHWAASLTERTGG